MFIVTVTVHNSAEEDCRRMSLTDRMPFEGMDLGAIKEFVKQVEDNHRELFPRGMSYSIPYTDVDIESQEIRDIEERWTMLSQADTAAPAVADR